MTPEPEARLLASALERTLDTPTLFGDFLDKPKGAKIADLCILGGLVLF